MTLLFTGAATVFFAMASVTLWHLRRVRRLPGLDAIAQSPPTTEKTVRCSMVIAVPIKPRPITPMSSWSDRLLMPQVSELPAMPAMTKLPALASDSCDEQTAHEQTAPPPKKKCARSDATGFVPS